MHAVSEATRSSLRGCKGSMLLEPLPHAVPSLGMIRHAKSFPPEKKGSPGSYSCVRACRKHLALALKLAYGTIT